MSHLPEYFEHLVNDRGLTQNQAADRLALVQNAFASSAQRRWYFANLAADKGGKFGGGKSKGKGGGKAGGKAEIKTSPPIIPPGGSARDAGDAAMSKLREVRDKVRGTQRLTFEGMVKIRDQVKEEMNAANYSEADKKAVIDRIAVLIRTEM